MNSLGGDKIDVYVVCNEEHVFSGEVGLNGKPSRIGWVEAPGGNTTGADLVKIFEVMAKSKCSKEITLSDSSELLLFKDRDQSNESNPLIRSTILISLLAGNSTGYYQALGYHCKEVGGDEDLRVATNALLYMTVGRLCKRPMLARKSSRACSKYYLEKVEMKKFK